MPSTFEPSEEGEFILRVFSEKKNNMSENDEEVDVGEPDDTVSYQLLLKYTKYASSASILVFYYTRNSWKSIFLYFYYRCTKCFLTIIFFYLLKNTQTFFTSFDIFKLSLTSLTYVGPCNHHYHFYQGYNFRKHNPGKRYVSFDCLKLTFYKAASFIRQKTDIKTEK